MVNTDDFNFYALVEHRFPADLDACSIETADRLVYSWRDLHCASGRIANWLHHYVCRRAARRVADNFPRPYVHVRR